MCSSDLFLDRHPLAGATTFTIEALIRPDGGAFEQRWLHLAADGGEGTPAANTRILFELRVKGDEWYLDAYARGAGYALTLIDPAKRHKVGRWYHVAQTYDGTTYRAYVDGVLQAEGPLAFTPQGSGRSSVGVRNNRVNYFKGAIREARFTPLGEHVELRRRQRPRREARLPDCALEIVYAVVPHANR